MNGPGDQPQGDHRLAAAVDVAPVVSVRGLIKRYGRREAVRGIDLDVRRPTLEDVYLTLTEPGRGDGR